MSNKLYKFKPFILNTVEFNDQNKVPKPRSGHRIVTTDTELYCFGGYNPSIADTDPDLGSDPEWLTSKPLFRELWRFSFVSHEWTRLPISDSTPKELVSHCAQLIAGKYMLIYGGTGFPFGDKSSNDLYAYNTTTNQWKPIRPKNTDDSQCPVKLYGQAMTTDDSNNLYVVGGTDGYDYTMDVNMFDISSEFWSKLYQKRTVDFPENRYRHEIVFYKNRLFVFGGGTTEQCFSLSTIPVFDLDTREWTRIETNNDIRAINNISNGYPRHRRCHDCVRIDNNVFVLGGINGRHLYEDIWRLDLETLRWTKLAARLSRPVCFHSASVCPSGRLTVFGGVGRSSERNNQLSTIWLKIPSLKSMSFEAILFYIKKNTNKPINELLFELKLPNNLLQNK